ncbi:MAG TPA: hypothetical protein VKE51_26405, partial [Vicinamibacterales bacterium]|nr:hypothetical protein [Vicinamibacterales bacterium]
MSVTLIVAVPAASVVPPPIGSIPRSLCATSEALVILARALITQLPRLPITFFILAASVACHATGATKPATAPAAPPAQNGNPPIVQPGAPGEASKVISAAAASDLSKVDYTGADIKFMQGMIGHHAQALEMV